MSGSGATRTSQALAVRPWPRHRHRCAPSGVQASYSGLPMSGLPRFNAGCPSSPAAAGHGPSGGALRLHRTVPTVKVAHRAWANARIFRVYSRSGRVVDWGTRRGPTARQGDS
jgi:hypothetical protein